MLETTKDTSTSSGRLTYDEALKHYFGDWVWKAAYAYLDHHEFDGSPLWLSRKLDEDLESVVHALEGLITLGLATRRDKSYRSKKRQFIIPDEYNEYGSRLNQHKALARQVLNQMSGKRKTLFRNLFLLADTNDIVNFYEKTEERFVELMDSSENPSDNAKVYCITLEGVEFV